MSKRIISGWTPSGMSREEEELREKLYQKRISFDEFQKRYKKLMREGKIKRDGRVIKDV